MGLFSEVNVKVEDGRLGKSGVTGRSAQAKIGVSNVTSSAPIVILGTMKPDEIREKLGNTPLADSCIDSVENGLGLIYAIPVQSETPGEKKSVEHSGSGKGTVSVSGNPNNAYDVVVKILEDGNLNEGAFIYSIDGGNSYSEEFTIPLAGTYEIPGTGLTVTFGGSESGGKLFKEGDNYSFSTTAPTASNQKVLKAVEMLETFNKPVEVCHIVGTSTKALWAALQSKAEEFLTVVKKPMIFLVEARKIKDSETIDTYLAEMDKEKKGISSKFLCISASYGVYTRKDLRTQIINMAGVISGLIGTAKESLSVGCVEEFPISSAKLQKLVPEGIEAYSRLLDEMGYTVIRQYTGKDNYYVSNANTMAKPGSDYPYVENVRVLNRIVREVSMLATDKVQMEIDPNNIESDIKTVEAYLNIAMDECKKDGIISDGEVKVKTEGLNILVDETLDISIEWIPMGTARVFNLTFGVKNPAKGGE